MYLTYGCFRAFAAEITTYNWVHKSEVFAAGPLTKKFADSWTKGSGNIKSKGAWWSLGVRRVHGEGAVPIGPWGWIRSLPEGPQHRERPRSWWGMTGPVGSWERTSSKWGQSFRWGQVMEEVGFNPLDPWFQFQWSQEFSETLQESRCPGFSSHHSD